MKLAPSPVAPSAPRPWALRAAIAGVAAAALGTALGTAVFSQYAGAAAMPWDRLAWAIPLFSLVTGLCFGVLVGGGSWLAVRGARGAKIPMGRIVLGAALGGALAGILPGLFGIAGFGSLRGPYAGTINILGSMLVSAIAFVALWAPRLLPADVAGRLGAAHRLALSSLAAIITASTLGLLGWSLVGALDLVPSFCAMKHAACAIGLAPFAALAGAGLGALAGALAGACCAVFVALAAATAGRRG